MPVIGVHRGPPVPDAVEGEARSPVPDGPYLVMGTGNAGRAAIAALADRSGPSSVVVWDDSLTDEVRSVLDSLARKGIASASDPERALRQSRAVVKSPGIPMDHPVVEEAIRRGIPVLDEFELGWRLSRQPVAAVTGTDGKSTTAGFVFAALRATGTEPLMTGNVEGFRRCPAMSQVPRDHRGWLVAEVSSYQTEGCPEFLPSAAVFTNLTEAHLGRHGSMDAYGSAKRRMFVRGSRAVDLAVLNADDRFGRRLEREVSDRGGRALTYGWTAEADYRIRTCVSELRRSSIEVEALGEELQVETRLPGAHNAENAVAALALSDGLGLDRDAVLDGLAAAEPIPGRFQPVDAGQDFDVVVDFAHTPDAVKRTLEAGRELVGRRDGRLIVVFGKVGKASRAYGEGLGRAARSGADLLVLCGSSLRGEHPLIELEGLLVGARAVDGGELEVVLDRRAAISRGLARARAGDLVAILGRGGRRRMTYDVKGRPGVFDDREVARELLREMTG
jgi:UDP-N-acetylmuramoyl-L-alanyl-D-glutamate--2,6-diaminopimelate ligase